MPVQSNTLLEIIPSKTYDLRYTLSFLVSRKALLENKGKGEITEELVEVLSNNEECKIGIDMLRKYIGEKGEERAELSEERKQILANYFGLPDANYLLTEWVKQALGAGV